MTFLGPSHTSLAGKCLLYFRTIVVGGNAKPWGEKPNALTRSIWNGLIRRNSDSWRPVLEASLGDQVMVRMRQHSGEQIAAEAEAGPLEKKVEVVDLVTILRLMEVPSSLLQDLLEVICERFTLPEELEELGGEGQDGEEHGAPIIGGGEEQDGGGEGGQELFQVSCSSHGSHLVSQHGFLLLVYNAVLICPALKFMFLFFISIGTWLASEYHVYCPGLWELVTALRLGDASS